MSESRPDRAMRLLQIKADVSTFICAICFVFLIYLVEHPPSGAAALGIMIPFIFVVFLHLGLGLPALVSAISTGRFYRNLWIYLYFLSVVLITLGYLGIYRELAQQASATYERYRHPAEFMVFSGIESGELALLESDISTSQSETPYGIGTTFFYCRFEGHFCAGRVTTFYNARGYQQASVELWHNSVQGDARLRYDQACCDNQNLR